MVDWLFKRRARPLTSSEIACLRAWLRTSPLPPSPLAAALPPTPEQALLLFSLTYGAGVTPDELSQMRVDALLDDQGSPDHHVRIRSETTKHRVSRRVLMHPDIRRDLLAFRSRHPDATHVAFVRASTSTPWRGRMSEHALGKWLQGAMRAVETTAPATSKRRD